MRTGVQLGPYAIVARLGAGGMGEVYRATDTRLDRAVAIKILKPHRPQNPRAVQRFQREALAVSKVNHPHICALYDIGEQDGVQFIVMEYIEGETLAQRLTRGALPLDLVLRLSIEIADALDHAHRHGIVHRDLKPANIMLTRAGTKLLDFGIAALSTPGTMDPDTPQARRGAETLTEEGSILGTLQYMAAEPCDSVESHKSSRLAPGTQGTGYLRKVGDVITTIPLEGGTPASVTSLDASRGESSHRFPSFLPDGRHFVYLATSTQAEHDGIAYLMETGGRTPLALFESDSQVVYAAPGYLLYMIGNTLLARPFDAGSLRVTGEPIPIAEQVERNTSSRRGAFTVSQTGVLAYRRPTESQLVWFHRDGRRLDTVGRPGHYLNPALSPDGTRVAVSQLDLKTGSWDIWLIEV